MKHKHKHVKGIAFPKEMAPKVGKEVTKYGKGIKHAM